MIKIFLILCLLIPSLSWGTTYYVDNTCPDTNPASHIVDGADPSAYDPSLVLGFPLCTGGSEKYYATVADLSTAEETTAPGDFILFRKGLTWSEALVVPETGTAGNIYTYGAFGTGNLPIIDGEDARNIGILADGKNYITIKNLKIINNHVYQIKVLDGQNIIIEKNIVTNENIATAHGIGVYSTNAAGYACSAEIRYNYCYDSGDDCYYSVGCITTNAVKFYGNVCSNVDDDCFDVDSTALPNAPSDIYVANNTSYDFLSACFDVQGGNATGTFINNICVQESSTVPICDGDANVGRCFVYMNVGDQDPDPSNLLFQNNIYYAATDPGGLLDTFFIDFTGSVSCAADPALCVTYTEWKARGDVSEANSRYEDPLIDLNLYLVTKQDSYAEHGGDDNCSDIEGILEVGSTWIDDNVTVFSSSCNPGNEQNIGAYGTRGECPVSIKY